MRTTETRIYTGITLNFVFECNFKGLFSNIVWLATMLGVLPLSRALSGSDTKNRLATIFVSRPRRQSLRMHVRPLNWSGELGELAIPFIMWDGYFPLDSIIWIMKNQQCMGIMPLIACLNILSILNSQLIQ